MLLPLLLIVLFFLNISVGSVYIPFDEIIKIFFKQGENPEIWQNILFQFRLPKAVTAVFVGAALSVSGLMMQTLFRNPLAGPFVLGISSGSSLGVALVVLASTSLGVSLLEVGFLGKWVVILAASLGAFAVLLLVVLVSVRVRDSMTLLIIGLMFGSATGAFVSVLQFFSDAEQIRAYQIWTFGSLSGLTRNELIIFIPVIIAGLLSAFFLSKPLDALLLGDNYAQSLGVQLRRQRFWIIVSTSLLAGAVTAFCGPIAFIGIAVPHLVRMSFRQATHREMIPSVVFYGAAIMLICDIISQLPGSQFTLPINAVTSLFGAPLIIWIVLRKRSVSGSFAG